VLRARKQHRSGTSFSASIFRLSRRVRDESLLLDFTRVWRSRSTQSRSRRSRQRLGFQSQHPPQRCPRNISPSLLHRSQIAESDLRGKSFARPETAAAFFADTSGDGITPPTIEPQITASPFLERDTLTINGGGTLLIVGGDRLISVPNNTVLKFTTGFLGNNTFLIIGCNLVITKLQ
jgi:hypothetical protein